MTPNWTPEDLAIVQERVKLSMAGPTVDALSGEELADPGPESELASKIVAHATGQGWPHIYFPQSKKVRFFLPTGFPDFVIAIPEGRTIFLETKAAAGELGEKQRLMCNMFRMLGHEYFKVKSFRRYLQITKAKEG